MFLRCPCGYTLTDVASPGCIPHKLLTDLGVERLQDAVDREVAERGAVQSWFDHFKQAAAIETWVCPRCLRLFVHVDVTGRKPRQRVPRPTSNPHRANLGNFVAPGASTARNSTYEK
jgi:hypothetical protein